MLTSQEVRIAALEAAVKLLRGRGNITTADLHATARAFEHYIKTGKFE